MTAHSRDRQLGLVVILGFGLLLVLPLLAMSIGMMGAGTMAGHWGGAMSPWFPAVGFLVPMLLVVGLLLGGVYVIFGPVDERSADEEALTEVRRAYAGGDLSEEDYQELRDRLESDR